MPSQSENKPFPVRLEPRLRERNKDAGGGRLLRTLSAIYLGEAAGYESTELDHIEVEIRRLEATPAADYEQSDIDHQKEDLLSVLRWEKDDLQRFRALNPTWQGG